jgi:hypothetical protein
MFKGRLAGIAVAVVQSCLVVCVLAEDPAGMRVWRDTTGRFEIRAEFLGMEYSRDARDTVVRLQTEDGREIVVPAKKLSDVDRNLLRRLAEARRPQPAARPTAEPEEEVETEP